MRPVVLHPSVVRPPLLRPSALRAPTLRPLAVLVVVGVAAMPAAAAGGLDAQAEAESFRSEGISLLSAQLMALLQEAHEPPRSPPGFRLTAPAAVVESTVRDPTVHGAGAAAGLDAQTRAQEWHDVTVQGTQARLDDRMDVFPVEGRAPPRLQAQTGCTEWTGPGGDEVVREPRIPTPARRTASAHVGGGARVADCGAGAQWVVTGDFRILLWERDADLDAREGRQSLRSGRLPLGPSLRSVEPAGNPPAARDQEVHLYVSGGMLLVPMSAATVSYVAPGASLEGASALVLRRASLRLGEGTLPIQAGALRLAGALDAVLRPSGGPLGLRLLGVLEAGTADGAAIAAPVQAATPHPPPAGVGGLLLAGAAGAAAGAASALAGIAAASAARGAARSRR